MIYLDNAATTLKKPWAVRRECARCLKSFCANGGRGGHKVAMLASRKIYECRESLATLFHIDDPTRIIFTQNATASLNVAIKGIITPDSHIIITGMEHNSVLRPIAASGASYSIASPDKYGFVSAKSIESEIRDNTKLIVATHASNIVGTINPIYEIGLLAKNKKIPFLVDAAQTAGVIPINVDENNISMLAFTGHKALYGPTGTGGLYISPNVTLSTLIEGGTGSVSESFSQPDFLPDRFESGTLNTLGIVGLLEGVNFVLKNTETEIHRQELILANRLIEGLSEIKGVKVYGGENRVGVIGFSIEGLSSTEAANRLDSEYNIACRGGMHCAYLAHKSIGTEENGLVRFSLSFFSTEKEIEKAIKAVSHLKQS